MITELFIRAFLGHLVADYLLQSRTMAIEKSTKHWKGALWCFLHCAIYAATVCLFLWTIKPIVVVLIFLSHWPIDRWALADKWLRLIKGRNILDAYYSREKYHEIDLAFSSLVYAATDNTIHLLSVWLIVKMVI